MSNLIPPPQTESKLCEYADAIAGLRLADLAACFNVSVPHNLKRDKGWVGQLLEMALGASAASRPEPDFVELGIELKSLPLNKAHKPSESTFISTIPLLEVAHLTWKTSYVYKKLARVLWVPVEADPAIPLPDRKIGTPLLWSSTPEQEEVLARDWQELTDMIGMGKLEEINARHGEYLQVRPKGADSKALCWGIGSNGERILTLPRGFYLRALFTAQILQMHYKSF